MRRIILFRFHKHPLICKDRLTLLKNLNPGIRIYGLYGGKKEDYKKLQRILDPYVEHIYCIRNKSKLWKWKQSDLAIRLWYREMGKSLSFDMAHVVEWDLLLCDSLHKLYKHIPKNSVGLTGFTLLKNVHKKWAWVSKEPYKSEWKELLKFVRKNFNYKEHPYASLGPGVCLPRKFLELFSSVEIPELCHDELRLPLFSQIFGFKLYNTGFYKKWFNQKEEQFFNCMSEEISLSTIMKELNKSRGARSFHPYRKIFNYAKSVKKQI